MAESFDEFRRGRLDRFIAELEDRKLKAIADKVGVEAKKQATKAAQADLGGDAAFSGWRRGSPFPLQTRYDHISGSPGKIGFKPTRRSAGPWTVAEFGRRSAEGPQLRGPRLTKTGKVSRARVKRYNGRTAGKDTASDALELIDQAVPGVVEREVRQAIRKFFN